VSYPEWADKPYGFARSFLRAARFVNSLTNGKVLSRRTLGSGGFSFVTLTVRLSRQTERGMYNLARREATRDRNRGFVVPSQNEWIKAAYFDPRGGGTLSYWKYPTNPGVFFKGGMADAPTATALNPQTGDVTNPATQPLTNYKLFERIFSRSGGVSARFPLPAGRFLYRERAALVTDETLDIDGGQAAGH